MRLFLLEGQVVHPLFDSTAIDGIGPSVRQRLMGPSSGAWANTCDGGKATLVKHASDDVAQGKSGEQPLFFKRPGKSQLED